MGPYNMFYGSIGWFICTFVAVEIATGYTCQDSNTGSSAAEPVQEVAPDAAVELGCLLDAGEGAVVALVSGGTRLLAHRAELAARSPVLQCLLQDAATGEVAVPDVEGPVLRQLLAYLYTLQAPQLPGMASQLLAAAHQYGLPALKAYCERQVAAQLTVQTTADTAVLAVRYSSDSLRRAAIDYIRAHYSNVTATQGWADAVKSQNEVMMKVTQLLSRLPPETSSAARVVSETFAYPATQPHSNYNRRQSPAITEPTMAPQTVPQPDDVNVSHFRSTARAASETLAYPATQPHINHNRRRFPATVAPTMAPPTVTLTDEDRVTHFRSVSPDEKGRRLIEAAMQEEVGELEALLAAGADVGARDGEGRTALHYAAAFGRAEAARRLLAAGAAADAGDSEQWTPLHYAAREGHAAVVRLLLAAGADVGARKRDGWTPLHLAAANGRAQVAAALREAGADRGARNDEGRTPLDEARGRNHQQVAALLEGNTAPRDPSKQCKKCCRQ